MKEPLYVVFNGSIGKKSKIGIFEISHQLRMVVSDALLMNKGEVCVIIPDAIWRRLVELDVMTLKRTPQGMFLTSYKLPMDVVIGCESSMFDDSPTDDVKHALDVAFESVYDS